VTIQSGSDQAFERKIELEGTTVDVPAGPVQLAIRVVDATGEIIDRKAR
jgi:hypothetical protein